MSSIFPKMIFFIFMISFQGQIVCANKIQDIQQGLEILLNQFPVEQIPVEQKETLNNYITREVEQGHIDILEKLRSILSSFNQDNVEFVKKITMPGVNITETIKSDYEKQQLSTKPAESKKLNLEQKELQKMSIKFDIQKVERLIAKIDGETILRPYLQNLQQEFDNSVNNNYNNIDEIAKKIKNLEFVLDNSSDYYKNQFIQEMNKLKSPYDFKKMNEIVLSYKNKPDLREKPSSLFQKTKQGVTTSLQVGKRTTTAIKEFVTSYVPKNNVSSKDVNLTLIKDNLNLAKENLKNIESLLDDKDFRIKNPKISKSLDFFKEEYFNKKKIRIENLEKDLKEQEQSLGKSTTNFLDGLNNQVREELNQLTKVNYILNFSTDEEKIDFLNNIAKVLPQSSNKILHLQTRLTYAMELNKFINDYSNKMNDKYAGQVWDEISEEGLPLTAENLAKFNKDGNKDQKSDDEQSFKTAKSNKDDDNLSNLSFSSVRSRSQEEENKLKARKREEELKQREEDALLRIKTMKERGLLPAFDPKFQAGLKKAQEEEKERLKKNPRIDLTNLKTEAEKKPVLSAEEIEEERLAVKNLIIAEEQQRVDELKPKPIERPERNWFDLTGKFADKVKDWYQAVNVKRKFLDHTRFNRNQAIKDGNDKDGYKTRSLTEALTGKADEEAITNRMLGRKGFSFVRMIQEKKEELDKAAPADKERLEFEIHQLQQDYQAKGDVIQKHGKLQDNIKNYENNRVYQATLPGSSAKTVLFRNLRMRYNILRPDEHSISYSERRNKVADQMALDNRMLGFNAHEEIR